MDFLLKCPTWFYNQPKKNNTEIFHYTSLATLEKLTQPESTFHLSSSLYLNDPAEGIFIPNIFEDFTKETLPDSANFTAPRLPVSSNNNLYSYRPFIASFTTNGNSLPMWVQYGDGGNGCCIGFKSSSIQEDLYKVTYNLGKFELFVSKGWL